MYVGVILLREHVIMLYMYVYLYSLDHHLKCGVYTDEYDAEIAYTYRLNICTD